MEFARDFFVFLGGIFLVMFLAALILAGAVTYRADRSCTAYGKLTGQEVALIGVNCYNKQGFRVL